MGRLKHFAFEALLIALLLITVAVIRYQDWLLARSLSFAPADLTYSGLAHSDAAVGGASLAAADPRKRMQWSCVLRASAYLYPYCAYELLMDGNRRTKGIDLSRTDYLVVDLDYQGTGQSLRLHLKNYDPRFRHLTANNIHKYNALQVPIRRGEQQLKLSMDQFKVADWWVAENHIAPELSQPQFDNVISIEFATAADTPLGSHRFKVSRLTAYGRYLSSAELYLAIMGAWAVLISGLVAARVIASGRSLKAEMAARQQAEKRAELFERHDPMTGFLNRRAFSKAAEALFNADASAPHGVVILDLDGLKAVNDVHGHVVGDELIIEMAGRIKAVADAEAIISRVGGDEFACLIKGDEETVLARVDQITKRLNQPVSTAAGSLKAGATLGVAIYPDHGACFATLFRAASVALNEGKSNGRGRFQLFDPAQSPSLPQLGDGADGEAEEGKLPEQPVNSLAFVSSGLLDAAIREACRLALSWPSDTAVCVAVSPVQLEGEWASERIVSIIDSTGLQRSNLVIEVSESSLVQGSAKTLRNLEGLQRAGIRIAVPDFRNGFKPYLTNIRLSHIRVDEAYLTKMLRPGEAKLADFYQETLREPKRANAG